MSLAQAPQSGHPRERLIGSDVEGLGSISCDSFWEIIGIFDVLMLIRPLSKCLAVDLVMLSARIACRAAPRPFD